MLVLFIVCCKLLQYLKYEGSHVGIVHCVLQIATVSNIIGVLAFFQQLCYHHLLLFDLFLMSLCILHIHLLVTVSDMVIYLHIRAFCIANFNLGSIIRQIRCYHGLHSPFESLIEIMSCH